MTFFPDINLVEYYNALQEKYVSGKGYWQNMPIVPVDKAQFKGFDFDTKMDAHRVPVAESIYKVDNSPPPSMDFVYSDKDYIIKPVHLMTGLISEDHFNDAKEKGINMLADALNGVRKNLDKHLNTQIFNLCTTTGNWTSTLAAGAVWTGSTGDPQNDILLAMERVEKQTGGEFSPNTMIVFGQEGKRALLDPDNKFYDVLKYTISGNEGRLGILKENTAIEKILFVNDYYNSANKGQTATMAAKASSTVWIGYMEWNNPSVASPSAFYGFANTRNDEIDKFGIRTTVTSKIGEDHFEDHTRGVKASLEISTNFLKNASKLGTTITGIY